MKKNLFFILFSTMLFGQNYEPFVNPSHIWKYTFRPSAYCTAANQITPVDYQLRLGNEVIINQNTYREVFKQFQFSDLASFEHLKNCDEVQESGTYLSFLNESNYNNNVLAGYIREDIEHKKVYVLPINQQEKLIYNFEQDYTVNPAALTLLQTDPVTAYNLSTTEYKFTLPYAGGFYYVLEQIGDQSDLINSTKTNIDGVIIDLKAFSTDNGATFYQRGNEVLNLTEIANASNYKISQNPVGEKLLLSNYKNIDQLQIVDASGKVILTRKDKLNTISTQHINKGTYYLVIYSDKKITKIPFVKK